MKKSPVKFGSPKKLGRPMTATTKQTTLEYEQVIAVQDHARQVEVSGKEIEIERLIDSIDIMKGRVAETVSFEQGQRQMSGKYDEADAGRVVLQQHVIVCTKELEVDTAKHNAF